MIIGLVLLGIVAALLFFGIAERVFKSFGVAYWLAFVMIGLLIGCAFIPSFGIGSVRFNVAGFIAPIVFAAVFYVLAARTHEVMRAVMTTSVITALFVSVWLLIEPITNDTVTVIIVGFLCGAVSFLVAKTKLAALCAVFSGMPIGEAISSVVNMFVYETPIELGTPATFDAVILAAVFSVVLFEAIAAIKRTVGNKRRASVGNAESSEEFINSEEYKKYFDE